MRFVYVLEDEPKFEQEIVEAIQFIDPAIQVRVFHKLEQFVAWVRIMMQTGPAAISQGGETSIYSKQDPVSNEAHQLVAVISKIEFLGVKQLSLLKKTKDLFIERKICTAEDPTAFVLTAFDDPKFKIKELENRILSNVMFKPFDRLILTQHLTNAIDGRHPPSKFTITNQKTTAIVEMLKDIELEFLSDVGFVTRSNRPIPVGAVSKYYGTMFKSERQRSIIAICVDCQAHPQNPAEFRAIFSYFAVDQTQISSLRKIIRTQKLPIAHMDWKFTNGNPEFTELNVICIDEEESQPHGVIGQMIKEFHGVHSMNYDSLGQFLYDLDPGTAMNNKDAAVKTLGGANEISLVFDKLGNTFLDIESDKKDLTGIFGQSLEYFKKKPAWINHALGVEQKERFRKHAFTKETGLDQLFSFSIEEGKYILKLTGAEIVDQHLKVKFVEPSKDEQVAWMIKHSAISKPVHMIVVNHRYFTEGTEERWTKVTETLKSKFGIAPKIVMTAKRDFTDKEERGWAHVIHDIFFKPVDRSYFNQKMKFFFPHLKAKSEVVEIHTVEKVEVIKAVNPVNVSEISEAGFVMEYYRPMSLGSFREIVLWQPYEVGAPELLATCNYVEEVQGKKNAFNCHFVFFGINDHFLKHIRVWIRDNYILSKEKS